MKISVYYQNVNGLKTKIDDFRLAICTESVEDFQIGSNRT